MNESNEQFYEEYAKHLARQIQPSPEIKSFIGQNPALIGDFAEAQIRQFVKRMMLPLRVSHGAVVASYSSERNPVRQVDTIIWTPNPLPPLIEAGDFALVPWTSSMGILEIKNSAYPGVGESIEKVLAEEYQLTYGGERRELDTDFGIQAALGVIILEAEKAPIRDSLLKKRIKEKKVVVLLKEVGGEYIPDERGLYTFINFLAGVRKRARLLVGDLRIDLDIEDLLKMDNSATAA